MTMREDPSEAEVISHKFMLRAGMIRKLASGIYSFLPLGLRCIRKVEQIVREEMNRAGAIEVLLPGVQPAELWQESGRWDYYGKELLRFKDRHGRDFCLGPTHEEVITDLVRREVRSYRQLPLNLYQIQTKFRDEIRPRFGLMRCREFSMKDAYSFDVDEEGAERSYWNMYETYCRIFSRCGLKFRAVEADTGAIGGSFSHEFMVLAETGEDIIFYCTKCDYSANIEKAETRTFFTYKDEKLKEIEVVDTPGMKTVEEVADYLGVEKERIVKTLIYITDLGPVAALVRGDHEVNEAKLKNHLGANIITMADRDKIYEITGGPLGYSGPIGIKIKIIADNAIRGMKNFITGANMEDKHLININIPRDFHPDSFGDIRKVQPGDICPRCDGQLSMMRGIEVGHIFKLGTKYSEAMKATFIDRDGKEKYMVMGCYGIGIGRTVAAAIEQNHDENGIIFPVPIAPYHVYILPINVRDSSIMEFSIQLNEKLEELGVEVILDDRDERPGVKFKDADLIGIPFRITVGEKIKKDLVELKFRRDGRTEEVSKYDIVQRVVEEVKKGIHAQT